MRVNFAIWSVTDLLLYPVSRIGACSHANSHQYGDGQEKYDRCLGNISCRGIYRFLDDHRAREVARLGLAACRDKRSAEGECGAAFVKVIGSERGRATHTGTALCCRPVLSGISVESVDTNRVPGGTELESEL